MWERRRTKLVEEITQLKALLRVERNIEPCRGSLRRPPAAARVGVRHLHRFWAASISSNARGQYFPVLVICVADHQPVTVVIEPNHRTGVRGAQGLGRSP